MARANSLQHTRKRSRSNSSNKKKLSRNTSDLISKPMIKRSSTEHNFKGRETKRHSEPPLHLSRARTAPNSHLRKSSLRSTGTPSLKRNRSKTRSRARTGSMSLLKTELLITIVDQYRKGIHDIFKKKARSRLHDIDDLLSRFEGKEHQLYLKICGKYEITPNRKLLVLDDYRCKIRTLFRQHDLARYDQVDYLISSSHGKEAKLYHNLCEEYGVAAE